jgi:hypothetical protein
MPNVPVQLDFVGPEKPNFLWQMTQRIYKQVAKTINGNISFGQVGIVTGTGSTLSLQTGPTYIAVRQPGGNIDGVWIWLQGPALANSDFTVNHNLGRPMSGWSIVSRFQAGDVYVSPTNAAPFSMTSFIFRESAGSGQYVLFIF